MLISSRHRFIFFHVPKVAGSSITNALQRYSDYPYARLYHYMYDLFGQVPWLHLYHRHISPAELKEIMGEEKFGRYFKFAFVRNPFDWHVSQYHFHQQSPGAFFHETFRHMDFEQYIDWAVQNIRISRSAQKRFLSDANGELLVDQVGKFDTLQEDFERICRHLGLNAELKIKNKSKRHAAYRDHYTPELRRKIEETFREDLETFGFRF